MIMFQERSILFATLAVCLTIGASAQEELIDEPDTTAWTLPCDTAGTDRGWEECVCAQREGADAQLHRVYEDVLIVLNRALAAERNRMPIDSSAVEDLAALHASVTVEQNSWIAYHNSAVERAATVETTYGPRHSGVPCWASVDLTLARVQELSELLIEIQDR